MNKHQLRESIKGLPPLPDNPPRFSWDFRRQELRKKILDDDIDGFEDWPIAREVWVIGDTPETRCQQESYNFDYGSVALNHQAFHLAQCPVDVSTLDTIYEFGSGYGTMIELLRLKGFKGQITSCDFPELLLIQRYRLPSVDNITFTETLAPCYADLFIANCSLSEVDRDVKWKTREISFQYAEIAYQQSWGGVDNEAQFILWRQNYPSVEWKDYRSPCMEAHRYLIGRPQWIAPF